ncbi:hypothetical protein JCM8547_003539 [Rhodosporidiobolus lusitaniae]
MLRVRCDNDAAVSQGAGFDLLFCSREHQKLVWFAHEYFCGVGKPFKFPLLSSLEVEQAKPLLFQPTGPPEPLHTMAGRLAYSVNISPDQTPMALKALQEGRSPLFSSHQLCQCLCMIRSTTLGYSPNSIIDISLVPFDRMPLDIWTPLRRTAQETYNFTCILSRKLPDFYPYPLNES